MNVAYAPQEIDDTEARYIQDALLDLPGVMRRRGPIQRVASMVKLPRFASGLAVTVNPRGNSRYAALTGDSVNGYLTVFSDDRLSTVDLAWPHALPTDPVGAEATKFRLVDTKPSIGGGAWIGTASNYGANGELHALAFWRGGNKADYATGTLTVARGSTAVTGAGTSWTANVAPGMFLFANTDDPYTDVLVGTVLSVNSNTSITLEKASPWPITAKAYTLKSIRGFMPQVTKGRITCATDSTTVSGGQTKFQSQGLGTGAWHLYRASDMAHIGKVSAVASEISLTLTANASIAMADAQYVAIRADWAAADKSIDNTGSVNKTGWLSATYAERQWFANNGAQFDKTYRLWFSDLNNPEAVDLSADGDWIPITTTTDVNEPIRGLMPTYNALLVYKDTETFAVYGSSPSSFSAKKLEDDGILSTMAVQPYGGGAIWPGRFGIYFYNGVQAENLTAGKLGDVYKNSIQSFDPLRYRAWSMVAHNHYFLFFEDLDPTIGVTKGTTTSTPTSWVLVINMDTRAIALHTNLHMRGAIQLPDSEGRGTWFVLNDALAAPTGLAATPSTTGGSLATATYYYKVVALDAAGNTEGSAEVSAAVTGPTGKVTLTWNAVPGAQSYRVYRGTAAGAQNVYYSVSRPAFDSTTGTTPAPSYVDTGAASTAGSPGASDFPLAVVADAQSLFDAEGVDEVSPESRALGPDFYWETKKFNAGEDLRLKRFKQAAAHYLAQGGTIKADTVLGLNSLGRPLSSSLAASVPTWSQTGVAFSNWSSVPNQYPTWNDMVQAVFLPKRLRFLKKTHHFSLRFYQQHDQMVRVRMGPIQLGFKFMRPGRV